MVTYQEYKEAKEELGRIKDILEDIKSGYPRSLKIGDGVSGGDRKDLSDLMVKLDEAERLRDRVQEKLDKLKSDITCAVDELPEDEAEIIHKRFFDGVSPREIAESMGISVTTVYRKLKAFDDDMK